MTFTANQKPLLGATITEPLVGAWTVEVEIESEEEITGSVSIELGSKAATFQATVVRGALEHGRWIGLLVGGKGGLSVDVASKHYTSVPVKSVLGDLMTDSGETLDGTITKEILDRALPVWIRPLGPPVTALDDLANELGVSWRVLRNGKIWLGVEKWPKLSMPHVEQSRGPSAGTLTVAPAESALVRPGVTFQGLRVSHVVTSLRGGMLRQQIWPFESKGDRVKQALRELIRQLVGNQIDYAKMWPASVVSQAGDGTLEVVPDDERIRGLGLKRLPIRHGLPGTKVKVPKNARVRVGFDAADPKRPYAAVWDEGAVTEIQLANGTQAVTRQGDMVLSGGPTTAVIFAGASPMVAGAPYTMTFVPLVPTVPPTPPSPYLSGVVSSGSPIIKG